MVAYTLYFLYWFSMYEYVDNGCLCGGFMKRRYSEVWFKTRCHVGWFKVFERFTPAPGFIYFFKVPPVSYSYSLCLWMRIDMDLGKEENLRTTLRVWLHCYFATACGLASEETQCQFCDWQLVWTRS